MSNEQKTHESWVDSNHHRQPTPVAHKGTRKRCTDAKCRAYRDGYIRGLQAALKVEELISEECQHG